MENLRWILLIVGAAIVLGIYLFSLYQNRKASLPPRSSSHRTTPVLGQDDGFDDFDYNNDFDDVVNQTDEMYAEDELPGDPLADHMLPGEVADRKPGEQAVETTESGSSDKVFTLYVMAPRGVPFRGPILLSALAAASLEYGDMQIFHRSESINGQEKILFSAANIKEPGIFDLSAMEDFTTEGIVLFLQIPGSADGVHAFDAMVESARILADHLDSSVCDATRSVLTNQTITHMREEVISCQLQQRVANAAS
ncbi:MAG: cell division protein ZipA [Pseudomonadota bacterium]